ncbi:MAG: thiamine pyrophosphate-binding protein [Tateyamaria sp.]|uniref:thiamine pyrophosphate-binding protein n=1 Tax=Tateyamaria sp. TaxID=1929288 RepID=UPI00329D85A3
MKRPLGAQISHMLKDRGVDVIFGIPGVHNQEMYRGIEEAGITHVLARHEQGAGFMADGYARASGKPGVAYVITGPGLCNIMTPMGQAYSDSVPMLVISSCLDETAAKRGQLHQMKDQRGAAATVCDWSEEARSANAAYTLIDRAFMEFGAQRARPKHLQVPIAQLEARAEVPTQWHPAPSTDATNKMTVTRLPSAIAPPVPLDMVDMIALRLLHAERPLFVFGGGARGAVYPDGPIPSILARVNAATLTTYAGRGVVSPDWDLSFGAALARPDSAAILDASDCVVLIGTDMAEVDIWRETAGHRPGAIHINVDPEVLAAAHPSDICLQYDASDVLSKLHSALEKHGENVKQLPKSAWSADIVAGYRSRWRAEVEVERPGIISVCDALREAVPSDTMIYSDMTQLAYTAKEVWDMDRPGHWHHPSGFGTLGYATPAAIGGAVARKGQPTMAIIGDYGFHYTMAELGVAVELGLPLPIILWDNAKLGEIEDSMTRAQIAPNAVVARNPDFCKLAKAFGAHTAAPKTLTDMQDAVRDAFTADGPTLIYLTPSIS